jgi:DNA-binding transcriptional LysR family regulator
MDLNALDLKKLRAFHFVVRYGNLRSAAARLHVTVSAVSFSIRSLEKSIEIELFERSPNKLTLTPAGQRFSHSVEMIFEAINQALAESALEVTSVSRLSIAVNSDLVSYFIPRISSFLKRYPDLELRIHIQRSSSTLRMIQRGEVDVGIGDFHDAPANIEIQPVVNSSISMVCSLDHPLARRSAPRLHELTQFKIVTLPESHPTRRVINSAFSKTEKRIRGYIEVGNCQTVINIVKTGIGIGLVHTLCAPTESMAGLHQVRLGRQFGELTFSMAYRRNTAVSPFFLEMFKDSLAMLRV